MTKKKKRESYFQHFLTMLCSEGATCETPVRQYLNNEFSQHLVLDWYFMVQYVNIGQLDTISGYRSCMECMKATQNKWPSNYFHKKQKY